MATRTAATAASRALEGANTPPVDRDRLLRKVLEEIPTGDRARFMEICMEKIPDNVAFIDGVILLSGYVQSDTIYVHDDQIDFEFGPEGDVDCKVDENGRIIELKMDPDLRYSHYWRPGLPIEMFNPLLVAFSRLERLRSLSIRCPVQLLRLDLADFLVNLEELSFWYCSNLVNAYFPLQLQQLPRLKKLSLICNQLKPSSTLFTWLAGPRSVPNLETLEFSVTESGKAGRDEADCILDFLCNLDDDSCCFRNSLQKILLEDDYVEEDHYIEEDYFEKLMTRVLQKFPNVTTIDLRP